MTDQDQPLEYYEASPSFKPRRCTPDVCLKCGRTFNDVLRRADDPRYPGECVACITAREQADVSLLEDLKRLPRDLALMNKAVALRWNVPEEMKKKALSKIDEILDKYTVDVASKDGPIAVDGLADSNKIAAIGVMVRMVEVVQKDEHLAEKNKRLDSGLATDRVSFAPVVIEKPWRPPIDVTPEPETKGLSDGSRA